MAYDNEADPLCYDGTDVLRNKAGLTIQSELDDFEFLMFLSRASEPLPQGRFDFEHYCAVHRHLFQDVYEWAGKPRTIRIAKGGNWFCYPENIRLEASKLFGWLADQNYFDELDGADFAKCAAHFISELNAIHPFLKETAARNWPG